MSKPIYEEIIDEIGTQTLARVGLNIFSIDTFRGYGASVSGTNTIFYQSEKRKGNLTPERKEGDTDERYEEKLRQGLSTYGGYMYESIDENIQNISNAMLYKDRKTYTSDTIADIRTVAGMIKDGKKYDNLGEKEKAKFDFINLNYSLELDDVLSGKDSFGDFKSQDTSTDLVTYENGKVVKKEQLKAIKDTKGLLAVEKTPLLDENGEVVRKSTGKVDKNGNPIYKTVMTNKLDKNGEPIYKYLGKDESGKDRDIDLKVPFDDYKRHRKNLEEMISSDETTPEDKKAAKMALEKLNKSNFINKYMCENPKATAVATQTITASAHVVQAGLSDAAVQAMGVLAGGTVYEIKDMFSKDGEKISIIDRIKRLIKKVVEKFKDTFKRGAGFGVIDALVGVITQFVKSASAKIKMIWTKLRSSAKSVFNAICSYIKGEIKTRKDLTIAIVKAFFSFTTVLGTIGLEGMIEGFLPPIIAPYLAPVLAIVVGAIVVVAGTKAIDGALNYLFMLSAELQKSKERRAEIEAIVDEFLPELIADNERLKGLIETKFKDMKFSLDSSFADLKVAINSSNSASFISSLVGINSVYGKKLKYLNFNDFDTIMLSDRAFKI